MQYLKRNNYLNCRRQSGAVMILSLVILTLLTLTAVTGMKTSITDQKMSGNMRNRELAFQAAEAGLIEATNLVNGYTAYSQLNGTNGIYGINDPIPDYYDIGTSWQTVGNFTTGTGLAGTQLANPPQYIIKYIDEVDWCTPAAAQGIAEIGGSSFSCPSDVYLLTSRGTGLTANTTMVLQAYFGRAKF